MPDQNQNLRWADGQIGDYQIPRDYDQPEAVADVYLSSDEVQQEVEKRLNNNRAALAALYGIDENQLDDFLSKPDPTTAREAFRDAFEEKMKAKARGDTSGTMSSVSLEEFLDDPPPPLAALYKAAVREEVNSRNYKNAVFLNSINYYPGETLETPVYVVAGGASGVGKSYLKEPSVEAVVKQAPKKRDAQNEVVSEGNHVVSADNGIARNTLQVGKMLLQVAFSKGYKEISDYNEMTKASAKKQIKSAATEAGLSLYQPKTYSKPGAYAAVLTWAKKHDGYHPGKKKYDVVATNIQAREEVVRNQGVKRSQLQKAFSASDIRLNQRKMPAESKRYGALIFNLDQTLTSLRSRSFSVGQTKSSESANDFQKHGIPVIDIDSTSRILVMFKNGKLEQVGSHEAENPEAFITHIKVLNEWRRTENTGKTEAKFRRFEKFIKLDSSVKVPEALTETQDLREAYAKFYKKYNNPDNPDRKLLSIDNFNEFLRLTDMQSDARERDRLKLLVMLQSVADPSIPESIIESTCSKFLESHYSFSAEKSSVKKQSDALLRSLVDLSLEEPLTKKAVTKSINPLELSPDLLSNRLIDSAAEKLEQAHKKMPPYSEGDFFMKIAIDFLRKKRPWLPPPLSRATPTHHDQILIESLQKKLLNGEFKIPVEDQKALGELMQAAIELKKLNHQTKLSYAFRRLWGYLTGKEPTRNNDAIKSAQEAIIAAKLGIDLKAVEPVEPAEKEKAEVEKLVIFPIPESPEPESPVSEIASPPPAVVMPLEKRTPTLSDALVVEVESRVESRTPTLAEPISLEVIQKTLETHDRNVKKDVLSHNRLWVGQVNPGPPHHPEPHYTVEIDASNKSALCYRVPIQEQKINSEALRLACEDAVFLAKPGDVLDMSQTPANIRTKVETELKAAIARHNKINLKIVFDKGPQAPHPTLGSPQA